MKLIIKPEKRRKASCGQLKNLCGRNVSILFPVFVMLSDGLLNILVNLSPPFASSSKYLKFRFQSRPSRQRAFMACGYFMSRICHRAFCYSPNSDDNVPHFYSEGRACDTLFEETRPRRSLKWFLVGHNTVRFTSSIRCFMCRCGCRCEAALINFHEEGRITARDQDGVVLTLAYKFVLQTRTARFENVEQAPTLRPLINSSMPEFPEICLQNVFIEIAVQKLWAKMSPG